MVSVLTVVLGYFCIAPVLTLIHEFFHGLPALLFTSNQIVVGLGSIETGGIQLNVGRVHLFIDNLYKPWIGICRFGILNPNLKALSLILGPVSSGGIAVISFYLIKRRVIRNYSLVSFGYFIFGYTIFQFLFTFMPISYPEWLGYGSRISDGKAFLNIWKGH